MICCLVLNTDKKPCPREHIHKYLTKDCIPTIFMKDYIEGLTYIELYTTKEDVSNEYIPVCAESV